MSSLKKMQFYLALSLSLSLSLSLYLPLSFPLFSPSIPHTLFLHVSFFSQNHSLCLFFPRITLSFLSLPLSLSLYLTLSLCLFMSVSPTAYFLHLSHSLSISLSLSVSFSLSKLDFTAFREVFYCNTFTSNEKGFMTYSAGFIYQTTFPGETS